jgi:hypothetical protein
MQRSQESSLLSHQHDGHAYTSRGQQPLANPGSDHASFDVGSQNFSSMDCGGNDANEGKEGDADDGGAGPKSPGDEGASFEHHELPDIAYTFGKWETQWSAIQDLQESPNPFHPWTSHGEFELVNWLSTSKLSQGAIDCFLRLSVVNKALLRHHMS